MRFKEIVENCQERWSTSECDREIVDFVLDKKEENRVNTRYDGDRVNVTIDDDPIHISVRFPKKMDRRGSHVALEGRGMIEYDDGDDYLIVEDVPMESEAFYDELPDVNQIDRERADERRARRQEYRRMTGF